MSEIDPIDGFDSPKFGDGKLLIKLIERIEPSVVNWDIVTEGATNEDKLMNGKYAISIAQKLGLAIFTTPKDIKELNNDMILTFVCTLYDRAHQSTT